MNKHLSLRESPIYSQKSFFVAAYDVDQRKQMTLPGLITQLQEAALESTRQLKVSVFDLEPLQLGWVLLGQRLSINKIPELTDHCTVITAPVGFEKVFTFRDFHLLDQSGAVLATATTTWMLMNTQSRRMARLPDWIKKLDEHSPPPEAQLERAVYKLQPPEGQDHRRTFQVGYHELDFNGHLTNTVYVRWMLEALPFEVLSSGQLQTLEVQYAKEARYGDQLTTTVQKTNRAGEYHHGLFRGRECLASMQTFFV